MPKNIVLPAGMYELTQIGEDVLAPAKKWLA
jgi:hypothetical protein